MMPSSLSAAAPSSMVRVLDFMRQKDHHALLDADAEVREAVAVHAALSFVRLLRTGLKRKRGVSWLRREATVRDRVCEEAVAYMALRRVAPRQLVEEDGGAAPLRRLLVEAVRPAKVVYMSCVKGAQRAWGEWLVQLLGVAPSDCCCTRVVLQADDGEEAAVELRFQHGRFPTVEGLSRGGLRRARASSYAAALAGHAECLHFLRSVGIAFTDRTPDGAVAVQAAAFNDDVPMLKLLYSLHPKAANEKVINIAARHGRLKMIQELCERGADMRDAACSAAQHNQTEALQLALTLGGTWEPPRYQAIVEAAATRGHIACLQVLHRAGIDMTTAVLRRYEASAAFEAAREGQVDVLRYFHSIGFDLRWPDYHFLSMPIYVAAAYGRNDCVRFLCDECPGVVTKKEIVLAAIEAAVRGHGGTLKLFLERGALKWASQSDTARIVRAAADKCGGVALE